MEWKIKDKAVTFDKEKMLEGCRIVLAIAVVMAIVYFVFVAGMAWIR